MSTRVRPYWGRCVNVARYKFEIRDHFCRFANPLAVGCSVRSRTPCIIIRMSLKIWCDCSHSCRLFSFLPHRFEMNTKWICMKRSWLDRCHRYCSHSTHLKSCEISSEMKLRNNRFEPLERSSTWFFTTLIQNIRIASY